MRKINRTKLTLKLETVKELAPNSLAAVAGGTVANCGCAHPTTTVLPTGDC